MRGKRRVISCSKYLNILPGYLSRIGYKARAECIIKAIFHPSPSPNREFRLAALVARQTRPSSHKSASSRGNLSRRDDVPREKRRSEQRSGTNRGRKKIESDGVRVCERHTERNEGERERGQTIP